MEQLQQDDPRQIGPYGALARMGESASSVRYLAQGPDGGIAVVSVARPALAAVPAFRRRFQAEARTAERLAGGWVQEPLGSRTDGELLWTASAYVPALTLREAIALAGPLPERAVRILGAGLAETLSRVHATGAVLHGLAPDTVLLAADGPRLTAFGALGAAAVAHAGPGGQLSVQLNYLTPEQSTGSEPGPASDIFVLGLLLAYAATGTTPLGDADRIAHAEPDLAGVPSELRPLVAGCLSKRPEDRPPAGKVAAELALEGASALAREGWLPPVLVGAVESQAGRAESLLSGGSAGVAAPGDTARADLVPADAVPAQYPAGTPALGPAPQAAVDAMPTGAVPASRVGEPGHAVPAQYPVGAPAVGAAATGAVPARYSAGLPAAPATDRRALLVGAAAGVAGIVVGGGVGYAVGDGESGSKPKAAPAPRRTRVVGVPPEPVWRYEHPGKDGDAAPSATLWGDRVLVLTGSDRAVGVDVRTGRQLWQLKEAVSASGAVPVDNALALVDAAAEFLWISALNGQIKHRIAKTALVGPGETLTLGSITGWDGATLWLTGHIKKGAAVAAYFFAYDLVARKWLWRTPVAGGVPPLIPRYDLIAVRPADIVVRQDAASLTPAQRKTSKGAATLLVFNRATGKLRQSFALPGVVPAAAVVGDATDKVFAAAGGELRAYNTRTGARLWRVAAATPAAGETGIFPYGKAVLRGPVLYVANRHQQVSAVDTATGRPLWRRSTEAPVWNGVPATALSAGGRTVLAGDGAQLTAFAARDGRRLWKFQEAGVQDAPGGLRYVPLPGGGRTVVVQRDRAFYALPAD
ncbi:PQQ-binding-like beta-propeller repeat protein [Streptomyces sp. NBC_00210]|uniref:outer membrane protein assembly factor BamB family protein n=1 Tax=unclassified Streptomyces TaxID=2593676 RepID=UPI00324B819F